MDASTINELLAGSIGGAAQVIVGQPLDTIKTRIQNANFESKVSGAAVVRDLVKHEGPAALFKGLTPKVRPPARPRRSVPFQSGADRAILAQILVVGPKLVFSYTLAQSLIPWFSKYV